MSGGWSDVEGGGMGRGGTGRGGGDGGGEGKEAREGIREGGQKQVGEDNQDHHWDWQGRRSVPTRYSR